MEKHRGESSRRAERGESSSLPEELERREYPVDLREFGGVYHASHPDLLGCVGSGDSKELALADLARARKKVLERALRNDMVIPDPATAPCGPGERCPDDVLDR